MHIPIIGNGDITTPQRAKKSVLTSMEWTLL